MRTALLLFTALVLSAAARADSTINATNKYAWGANFGWINWRDADGGTSGAVISEYFCSGYLWGANVGWLNLGDGSPDDGIDYLNNSGDDFGVNHLGDGSLRGLAYGANIGWANFEATGNPRVDLATGRLSGFAWSANCGWINLGSITAFVQTDTIPMGRDSDGDGITDAWELQRAGDLTTFDAIRDTDGDGASDLAEYLADTDPLDPGTRLRVKEFAVDFSDRESIWTLTWTSEPSRFYRIEAASDLSKPWELVLDRIPPEGKTTTHDRIDRPLDTQTFFRVQAYRPLAP